MNSYNFLAPKELNNTQLDSIISLDKEYFDWPWSDAVWSEFSLAGKYYLNLVEVDGLIVGFSLYLLSPLEELAHLLKVVIHPSFRCKGIAKKLIERDIIYFKKSFYNKIYLEFYVENKSARFLYESLGFIFCSRVKSFYGLGKDADTMIIEF